MVPKNTETPLPKESSPALSCLDDSRELRLCFLFVFVFSKGSFGSVNLSLSFKDEHKHQMADNNMWSHFGYSFRIMNNSNYDSRLHKSPIGSTRSLRFVIRSAN